MKVSIINYIEEVKGCKKGLVDIKVEYDSKKVEIFRSVTFFAKDGRRWLGSPNVKREDDWLPIYERTPAINPEILVIALEELKKRLDIPSDEPYSLDSLPF